MTGLFESWQCGAADRPQEPSQTGTQIPPARQGQTEWGLGTRSPLHGDKHLVLHVTETRGPGQ